ncbi:MAG: relaxase/mobilization nuclease domain-containing protein [Erysipelotrichaceae bacterium]|nr:relaxase/mobilization nuclease domain-containing protein [Erysipelotrichaceae bacterium]
MATTKIWAVKDNLKRVLDYASNPEKTENEDIGTYEFKGLKNVIKYTVNDLKTEKQFYVSGINCEPSTALDQMISTKKAAHKEDGVLAFHCYQSFRPGEVTPETAHKIGIELAKRMWGNDFEVLVTTHLDKKHFHNHFVVNSVSWSTHKRFLDSHSDYDRFRRLSDELCKEYSLSVVKNPKKGKHYKEWHDEQQRIPTRRTLIIDDVERAIANSMSFTMFIKNMEDMGYEVKTNVKHIAVKPPGGENFYRLHNLTKDEKYSEENIKYRIFTKKPSRKSVSKQKPVKYHYHGNLKKAKKLTGLKALYFHYMYRMGIIPQRAPNNKKVSFIFKEELRYMDKISSEAILLSKNNINTIEELESKKDELNEKIDSLTKKRRCCYNKIRRCKNLETKEMLQSDVVALTDELKKLRKEVKLYDDIKERSSKMKNKLDQAKELERKDDRKYEYKWRNG